MLWRACKVLCSVRSSDVLVSSWIRNWRCFSDAFKGDKSKKYTKPKKVKRMKLDAAKKEQVMALTERVKTLHAKVLELEKKHETEKAKIVRGKLILILKELTKALRQLRQLK